MEKKAGIDDGAIGNREMDSGDIDAQDVKDRPFMSRILPATGGDMAGGKDNSANGSTFFMKEDETENSPDKVVMDQAGNDTDWFQPTRYPTDNGRHRMQITTTPEDPQIESTGSKEAKKGGVHHKIKGVPGRWEFLYSVNDQMGMFLDEAGNKQQFPMEMVEDSQLAFDAPQKEPEGWAMSLFGSGALDQLFETMHTRMPGSDEAPLRKSVPSDEGGTIGIDEPTGGSEHVVDPSQQEMPEDNFKGDVPASNTRRDWRETTATRQIGPLRFVSAEIFVQPDDELGL